MRMPIAVRVQHLLPQRLLCALIYHVSRSRRHWFKSILIAWFARRYRIDLDEAQETRLSAYPSFNAFFTRALRAGARPVDPDERAIVSPADGQLTQAGSIDSGRIVQAKGFGYSLAELLGDPAAAFAEFHGGATATIYLAPHNYHRVHVPVSGTLVELRYIPGRRFSVNAQTARWITRLYCRNERLVCWFDSALGRYAVVLVGALNVSSISTAYTGEIRSGGERHLTDIQSADYRRGDEFARFNLGSTVILVLPKGAAQWLDELEPAHPVRVGERIGTALQPGPQ